MEILNEEIKFLKQTSPTDSNDDNSWSAAKLKQPSLQMNQLNNPNLQEPKKNEDGSYSIPTIVNSVTSVNSNAKLEQKYRCHRRKGPNFGRVFLMLNYTDITENTYIQS